MVDVSFAQLLEIALPLFLIMDPVGNSALCLALLREHPPARQRRIILRELLIALAVLVAFQFLGDRLLGLLEIHQSTLRVGGGVILFIISIKLVFPPAEGEHVDIRDKDPFIVPIAVPLIAGPSLLAAVMLYAHRQGPGGWSVVSLAILMAWAASFCILILAPELNRVLGRRGMRAAERLMGLILVFLSVQMLEDGVKLFVHSL